MNKIILVQHFQSEHHINNMSGGWTDTPLTDLGKTQAEIVGTHLDLDVMQDKGLYEINTGVAAGKTKDWARTNRKP
ncbi:hypothetical protein J6TS2_06110 [Heyndrickxia sporothermodurans]|nr:hypothetical protein J6TS2_06110 [Heyndrickxia sporothermodurans]